MLYVHTVNCKIVVEVIDACRNQLIYNRKENLTVVDYVEIKSFTYLSRMVYREPEFANRPEQLKYPYPSRWPKGFNDPDAAVIGQFPLVFPPDILHPFTNQSLTGL